MRGFIVPTAVLCCALLLRPAPPAFADDWLPISPEELAMTGDPHAPGAQAIYLYRQVDRDDIKMVEHDYLRIKILTEEGRKHADIEIPYFRETGAVHDIKARVISPGGAIANFNGKIYDKTVYKARGLKFQAKTFTLPDVKVGSILEYRYDVSWDSYSLFDSHWILDEELFTRRAKFTLKLNTQFASRWIGSRLPPGVPVPARPNDGILRMEISNIAAFQTEDYMPPENELKARMDIIYSSDFVADATKYWKDVDKKFNERIESFVGKQKAMEQAVAETVSPGDPPETKLQKLYVAVQTLRNFTSEVAKTEQEAKREKLKDNNNVEDVWKHRYGYGSQLTWLYLGLVRAAGFEAYPVMVSRRDTYFFAPDALNSGMLNDNVVLVRLNGKDLYFDPGTPMTPFGLLPWSESGVKGLRVDKNGGNWVTTSLPLSSESRVVRTAALRLTDEGALDGKLTISFTGLEALRRRIEERNEDDAARKKYLEDEARRAVPVGIDVELKNQPDWKSSSRELTAEYSFKVPGWASAAGRKALLPVGLFGAEEKHLFEHSTRVHPVYFSFPFQTVDDVAIDLPLGWRISSLPAPQSSDIRFSTYESTAEDRKGSIHLKRVLNVQGILLPTEYYGTLRSFIQKVRAGDEQQIIVQPAAAGSN